MQKGMTQSYGQFGGDVVTCGYNLPRQVVFDGTGDLREIDALLSQAQMGMQYLRSTAKLEESKHFTGHPQSSRFATATLNPTTFVIHITATALLSAMSLCSRAQAFGHFRCQGARAAMTSR